MVMAPAMHPNNESSVAKPKVANVPPIPVIATRSIMVIYLLEGDGPK